MSKENISVDPKIVPKTLDEVLDKYNVEIDFMLNQHNLRRDIEGDEDKFILLDIYITKLREGLVMGELMIQEIRKRHPEVVNLLYGKATDENNKTDWQKFKNPDPPKVKWFHLVAHINLREKNLLGALA